MSLRELAYQDRVLRQFETYLTELAKQKRQADKIAAANEKETDPELLREVPDYAARAWEAMRKAGQLPPSRRAVPYSPRADGTGRTVPNATFKVPTGGGKTYLAVQALAKLFTDYLGRSEGFVLWIVPNEAIYAQTLRQLSDRQHPYRQLLDVLSGNRTRLLQKGDPLAAADVEAGLCVMLLMLASSNRQDQATLKLFQDRGDVQGFFPAEGEMDLHAAAIAATPNLDRYDMGDAAPGWPMVKDSLGNALRQIRPVVVMDEGQRAVSELAYSALYGFNPCFVLELTATPKDVAAVGGRNPRAARPANVLVEVQGFELDLEGMVKMPINLDARVGHDWRDTLAAALERLRGLDAAAAALRADKDRYIRPILLVQVERTGDDQRDGLHVHALDAKEWLVQAGLGEPEIAIKTSATNDLASPENQDLLAPTNRVRVIITKQALQEGWDCPFAYVLCALAASSNHGALTQLIGRILRQPQAEKTRVAALDECYVLTHRARTADVVAAIKKGLEEDGLGDLVKEIRPAGDNGPEPSARREIPRRAEFAKAEIYLPLVLRVANGEVRELDYEEDVLFQLDWAQVDVAPLVAAIPDNAQAAERQLRRIRLAPSTDAPIVDDPAVAASEAQRFDLLHTVRMVSDLVPNPWVAHGLVRDLRDGLRARGFSEDQLGSSGGLIVQALRRWLDEQRVQMAEAYFRSEVVAGRIQFRLRTDGRNWRLPARAETFESVGAPQLIGKDGGPLAKSLFSPIYRGDFANDDERDIAIYLDAEKALQWWHRNVARRHYALQGWRRERIYPDFIFAMKNRDGQRRMVVLEVKGEHLAGNADTEYKQAVMQLMTETFDAQVLQGPDELPLATAEVTTLACVLIPLPEWPIELPKQFRDA